MNILIVNTSCRTGGAAIAASRLAEALKPSANVAFLSVDSPGVGGSWSHKLNFLLERGRIWLKNGLTRNNLFSVDIASDGTDITRRQEFQQADVVHLHWVNQGMLSLDNLRRIMASGKPVVWTMHDMWPFTAICHYSGECDRYTTGCHSCPMLNGHGGRHDLSFTVYCKKKQVYSTAPMTFVGCSRWIADLARDSSLTAGHNVVSIPNPIATDVFAPVDKATSRVSLGLDPDKDYLLFSAMKATNPIKGFDTLRRSIDIFAERYPEAARRTELIVAGRDADEAVAAGLALTVRPFNYVTDRATMVNLYNAASVFVIPSKQDNLPNTVMEALSCGVPCVGFNVGGIPEMIDHDSSGLIVDNGDDDAAHLAAAINSALEPSVNQRLSQGARRKVVDTYAESVVARQFMELYESLIK